MQRKLMDALFESLLQMFGAGWGVITSLAALITPWAPLLAWIAFWLFGVNWQKLRTVLLSGGGIAVILMGLVVILVWGSIAPPESGFHHILGLTLSNYFGKMVYVTTLIVIMVLCGLVQLSGCCGQCCSFYEEPAEPAAH